MRPYAVILYLTSCITLGAVADGLNVAGVQTWGHLLEAYEALLLFSVGFLFRKQFFVILLSYAFLRVGLFDYIFNLSSGQDFFHVGGTNWWDMMISKWPPVPVLGAKVLFLITGVAIPLKEIRR
jgi:hypothetical protein